MYHSILVDQNASEGSVQTLEIAMWFAAATSAHLTLVHLENRAPLSGTRMAEADVAELLEKRARICRQADLLCNLRPLTSWSTHALVDEAKWYDLVVVGKGGAGGENASAPPRTGLGAISKALLAASPVPLLIADPSCTSPRHLLVAFDDTPDACTALRIAADLALERKLELHVVEVTPKKKAADHLERAREYIDDCVDLVASFERLPGKSADSLLSFIREREIHLTFLPALDRSLFGHKLTSVLAHESASSIAVPRGSTPPVY